MYKNQKVNVEIIDAKGLILGRMASKVAKELLNGKSIIIVNSEDAIISGKKSSILQKSSAFLQVGHFRKGPFHPRAPDKIVKKVIRGMLPRRKPRGIEALKRLRVHVGVPSALEKTKRKSIEEANAKNLKGLYIKVSDLSHNLGWKE